MMELNININTDEYCNVMIKDNSIYLGEYVSTIIPNKYKFSETVSIIGINHLDTREDELTYYHVKEHHVCSFKIPIKFDGPFVLTYIVLPTKQWYNKAVQLFDKEKLLEYYNNRLYIYDSNEIIEITSSSEKSVSISEFVSSGYSDNLSVFTKLLELLSICRLRECYVNLCKQIFEDKNFSPCWGKNKVESELIYKRDLVWMAINVITYLWKNGNNSYEILRILKLINKCNGLCNPYPNNNSKQNGCGCSSK